MGIQALIDTQVLTVTGSTGDVMTVQADGSYLAATPAGASPGGSSGEIQYNNAGAFGGTVAVVYAGSGSHLSVTAQAATDVPVTVQGAVSQTANLTEWKTSAGVVMARVDATGRLVPWSGTDTGAFSTLCIGPGSVASGANSCVAYGRNATATKAGTTALGDRSSATQTNATAVGLSASCASQYGVAIGAQSSATTAYGGIAIGDSARATADRTHAIGRASVASHTYTICIGSYTASTASNQFIVGSSDCPIYDVYVGIGVVNSVPVSVTYNGTGGSGTDIAGGDINIAGGKGTGSAAGGVVNLQTAISATSGTSLNSLETGVSVDGSNTAGETRMLLYDVDAGSLVRVSVGAADSGGTGYKVLRVPN